MANELKVSPPWITYYNYIDKIFEEDSDVVVAYDNAEHEIKLFVNGNDKADAIDRLIVHEVDFGNVKLKVTVIPSNEDSMASTVRKAFTGNDAVEAIIDGCDKGLPFFDDRTFVLFRPEVVQFFNDNLNDYYGFETTLYQTIARKVFDAGASVAFGTFIV